jgi:2-iminobutanoate/2-iminopropanoate deaminase
MAHRRITSGEGVPPAGAPYSPAVVAGDICFISGQIAIDPSSGEYRPAPVEEEGKQCLDNLFACLRAAGFEREDLCSVTVLLAEIGDFAAFNSVYEKAMPAGEMPARIAYEVGALPLGAKVEVQGIARRPR